MIIVVLQIPLIVIIRSEATLHYLVHPSAPKHFGLIIFLFLIIINFLILTTGQKACKKAVYTRIYCRLLATYVYST